MTPFPPLILLQVLALSARDSKIGFGGGFDPTELVDAAQWGVHGVSVSINSRSDWASKAESAFRIFGGDRALLLVEGIAIAKLIMLAVAYPFRRVR
jgi:hypothetical protein